MILAQHRGRAAVGALMPGDDIADGPGLVGALEFDLDIGEMVGGAGPAPHALQGFGHPRGAMAGEAFLRPVFDPAIRGEDLGDGLEIHEVEGAAVFGEEIGDRLAVQDPLDARIGHWDILFPR